MMTLLGIAGFLLLMLLASELGRRLGVARIARDPGGLAKGIGAAEAAVFGLLGLLLAFSFSGAASRFEDRRHLVTSEGLPHFHKPAAHLAAYTGFRRVPFDDHLRHH